MSVLDRNVRSMLNFRFQIMRTLSVVTLLFCFKFLLLSSHAIFAQSSNDDLDYNTVQITNQAGTTIYAEDAKDIIGSPLLKESFKNGRILFDSGKASEIMPLNYDSYKKQILFIKGDKIMVLNTSGVKGFLFEKPEDFSTSDKVQEVFSLNINHPEFEFSEPTPVQVLYDQGSGLKLLALHETNILRSNSKDPFTGKETERYMNSVEYYLQKPDGELEKLRRLRDRDIIRKFERKQRQAFNDFKDENDLDSRSEKDLVKLMSFIDNSLKTND